MRVIVLEFLDTDVFNVSAENCIAFLDPLIDSWDIDLNNFGMEIVLNRRLTSVYLKKLEFVERDSEVRPGDEPGLKEFLRKASMSGDATVGELDFLKRLRFDGARPTALYYYRELQNLRDPLNFRETPVAPQHKYGDANALEKQIQRHDRESAIQRWAETKPRPASKRLKTKARR
jgi:hypothetical protein